MEPQLDHYIGYVVTTVNNKDGNLVIEFDNGPYQPIRFTVSDMSTKEPVTSLVLVEATPEKLSFAQTAKGGAQNVVDIDIEGHDVEIDDPKYEDVPMVDSAEAELPPDPSPDRVKEGPDADEEAEPSTSAGA